MRKLLLISEPEEEINLSYEQLEKLYIAYRRRGILYEPVTAVLLYAGALSGRNLRSILQFERNRLKNKKMLSKVFGKKVEEIIPEVIEAILDRLMIVGEVKVDRATYTVTMKLPYAIALGVEPDARTIISRGVVAMSLDKAYDSLVDVYVSLIERAIEDNKERIIETYGNNEVIRELVSRYFKEVEIKGEREVKALPPCVEQILEGNVEPGSRNTALVSMVHILKFMKRELKFKISDEEIEEFVRSANSKFPEPLPEREVANIIKYHIHTYKNKVYNGCAMIRREAPELCPFGDPKECWRTILSSTTQDKKIKRKKRTRKVGGRNGSKRSN